MKWKIYWTLVYAANLIVPIMFANGPVSGWGWIGLIVAVGGYWFAGIALCSRRPLIVRSLVFGGIVVGLSQFVPIIHMLSGLIGLGIARPFEHLTVAVGREFDCSNALSGFVATLVTGGLLLALATVIGLPVALYLARDLVQDEGNPLGKLPVFDPEFDGLSA